MIFGQDIYFWLSVGGATVVKLLTHEHTGTWPYIIFRGVTTAFCAVTSAVIFTDPLIALLDVPAETFKVSTAAILALTGEGLMRILMRSTNDFEGLAKFATTVLKIIGLRK